MKAKVLSWNIWQGKHIEEVVDFLKSSNADIIGLQEVSELTKNNSTYNTAEYISKLLGYEFVYYTAFRNDRHEPAFDQGNALLSRFPIQKSFCHFLSGKELYQRTAETEPRIAVEADILINGETYNFFVTHLAYSFKFQPNPIRDMQVDTLLKVLSQRKTILMGDFNCPATSSEITRVSSILRNADSSPLRPTWTVYPYERQGFRENKLAWRLDNIFVSSDITVDSFDIENTKGSDHLPVSMILDA